MTTRSEMLEGHCTTMTILGYARKGEGKSNHQQALLKRFMLGIVYSTAAFGRALVHRLDDAEAKFLHTSIVALIRVMPCKRWQRN